MCQPRQFMTFNLSSEHKKSTVLSEVGLQVWRGAFLLNDFILCNRDLFSNTKVLELGSGVGLTSILASIYAKKVICTGKYEKNRTLFLGKLFECSLRN